MGYLLKHFVLVNDLNAMFIDLLAGVFPDRRKMAVHHKRRRRRVFDVGGTSAIAVNFKGLGGHSRGWPPQVAKE